jgi:hypothetical protein
VVGVDERRGGASDLVAARAARPERAGHGHWVAGGSRGRAERQRGSGVPSAPSRWRNLCMAPPSPLLRRAGHPRPGCGPRPAQHLACRSRDGAGRITTSGGTASNASRLTTRCWPGHALSAVDTAHSAPDGHHDQPPVPTYSHLRCGRLPLERLGLRRDVLSNRCATSRLGLPDSLWEQSRCSEGVNDPKDFLTFGHIPTATCSLQ